MPTPIAFVSQSHTSTDSSPTSFGTSETVLGHGYLSAANKPPGANFGVNFVVECSAVTGTATVRLRRDSASGTILATATITAAGAVTVATGTIASPATPVRLFVTGQNSSGSSSIRMFSASFAGDGTDPTFDTLSGTSWTELSPWASGLMFRDSNDRPWLLDRDAETAYSRDELKRVFPQMKGAGHRRSKQRKPWVVKVGTDLWVFSLDTRSTTPSLVPGNIDSDGYEVTVLDGLDLSVKFTSQQKPAVGIRNFCAVYDGSTAIWMFWTAEDTFIYSHRWPTTDIASGAASTVTYRNVAGAIWNGVDAQLLVSGEIAVAATSLDQVGNTAKTDHSYLNASTGAAKSSPAAVTTSVTILDPCADCCSGVSILENQADAATTWRYSFWQSNPAVDDEVLLIIRSVNATTLAVTSSTTVATVAVAATDKSLHVGNTSGYVKTSDGLAYVWAHLKSQNTGSASNVRLFPYDQTLVLYKQDATVVQTVQSAWLASKPFQLTANDWYVLTGYDDGEESRAQRCLHVRRSENPGIIAQIGYSEMAAAFHEGVSDSLTVPSINATHNSLAFAPPVVQISANLFAAAVLAGGEIRSATSVRLLTLDFAAVYSRGAVGPGDIIVYPGGVPQVAGPRDNLHDLSPLVGPPLATTAALGSGSLLGTFLTAYLYRFIDASGRAYQSPLSPQGSHQFTDSGTRSLTLRNLVHIGRGTAFIEIYASQANGATLSLQHIVRNNPLSKEQTIIVQPARWVADTEAPYTTGGGLVNFPPPPCRSVDSWRDRVFLSGTGTDGEVWASQEAADGLGVRLNPVLRSFWTGAGNVSGPIYGIAPVDWNYLAVVRSAGVAVLSGPGPDGRGSGGYVVQELNTRRGTVRPMSLVTGQNGACFQGVDGLVYLVTPGLQVLDVAQGAADYLAGATVCAAAHMVSVSQLWFFLSTGVILVLDYKHPSPDQPAGQWYQWTSPALDSYCIGAVEEGDGSITWLQANKVMRRLRTTGATFTDLDSGELDRDILMRVKTGKLALADLQGETLVDDLKFLGQHLGTSALLIQVTNDAGTPENHPVTTASPMDYQVRPGNCLREQEIQVSIEETASSTEGFVFDGLAIEYEAPGRTKRGNTGKVI